MHAVQLRRTGSPLVDAELPLPSPGPGEILVRVTAAGVCRSDLHYRAGASSTGPLPQTLGHEIAGIVDGKRVCVHYLVSCGECEHCVAGREQFCVSGQMIGKHRDGGFAEYVVVPRRNLVALPDSVGDAAGAVMMCSTATALHALRKADLRGGETVAVFGVGGLGMSAVQLALVLGARTVFAVDIDPERLSLAEQFGAVAVNARATGSAVPQAGSAPGLGGLPHTGGVPDPVDLGPVNAIRKATGGRGVDVSVELLGLAQTVQQAVAVLAPMGRAAVAGITDGAVPIEVYRDIVGREAVLAGVSDHTRGEIELILDLASSGKLSFDDVVTRRVPLAADAVNDALDTLERFGPGVRTVVDPTL